jgi:hypothetical protein
VGLKTRVAFFGSGLNQRTQGLERQRYPLFPREEGLALSKKRITILRISLGGHSRRFFWRERITARKDKGKSFEKKASKTIAFKRRVTRGNKRVMNNVDG